MELARAESEQRRAEVRLPFGEPDKGEYGKGAKAGKADSPEVAAEKAEAKAAKEEKELKKKIKVRFGRGRVGGWPRVDQHALRHVVSADH